MAYKAFSTRAAYRTNRERHAHGPAAGHRDRRVVHRPAGSARIIATAAQPVTLNSIMIKVSSTIYPVQPVTPHTDWSRGPYTLPPPTTGAHWVWVTHVRRSTREPHPSSHAMAWHATRTVPLHSVQDAHEPDLPCVGGQSRYTPCDLLKGGGVRPSCCEDPHAV